MKRRLRWRRGRLRVVVVEAPRRHTKRWTRTRTAQQWRRTARQTLRTSSQRPSRHQPDVPAPPPPPRQRPRSAAVDGAPRRPTSASPSPAVVRATGSGAAGMRPALGGPPDAAGALGRTQSLACRPRRGCADASRVAGGVCEIRSQVGFGTSKTPCRRTKHNTHSGE